MTERIPGSLIPGRLLYTYSKAKPPGKYEPGDMPAQLKGPEGEARRAERKRRTDARIAFMQGRSTEEMAQPVPRLQAGHIMPDFIMRDWVEPFPSLWQAPPDGLLVSARVRETIERLGAEGEVAFLPVTMRIADGKREAPYFLAQFLSPAEPLAMFASGYICEDKTDVNGRPFRFWSGPYGLKDGQMTSGHGVEQFADTRAFGAAGIVWTDRLPMHLLMTPEFVEAAGLQNDPWITLAPIRLCDGDDEAMRIVPPPPPAPAPRLKELVESSMAHNAALNDEIVEGATRSAGGFWRMLKAAITNGRSENYARSEKEPDGRLVFYTPKQDKRG
ncbi:imm11 family protein [Vannielia litorea]|uniref:imm11 family protein n=1 Tax=Vannielia litorea TaxID=1217970 RepID=UPI001C98CD03|nr:DUF1629 domain-containing protein [Vannielia litorea]MBY6048278.1 hypothetical protein [Vannielia litorea]MBY6075692.1 hypothetical protein [Vannielia litorea]